MTLDQMIAVLEAAKMGEKIEYRRLHDNNGWEKTDVPGWSFNEWEYRVAPTPKPKLVPHWPIVCKCKLGWQVTSMLYTKKQALENDFRLLTEYPPIMLPEEEA